MKRIIKYTILIIAVILLSITVFVYHKAPELNAQSLAVIENVFQNELPELIPGDNGFVENENVKIWYESRLPVGEVRGSFILHMGLGNDALGWPEYFMQALLDNGYQVVRYDQRGTGWSDWIKDWKEVGAYSLSDMAKDAIEIQNFLEIEKASHFGGSLGGMIAQQIAIEYPERCTNMISIMSSGDIEDPALPSMNMQIIKKMVFSFLRYGLFSTEKGLVKMHVTIRHLLQGTEDAEVDVRGTAEAVLYNVRHRNGFNPEAAKQHTNAVRNTGSRIQNLGSLTIPVLIIHGTTDPLIPVEHGIKCSKAIPGSKIKLVEGMGHDIPISNLKEVMDELMGFIKN